LFLVYRVRLGKHVIQKPIKNYTQEHKRTVFEKGRGPEEEVWAIS